jgi:hypothetical protein
LVFLTDIEIDTLANLPLERNIEAN